MGWVWEAGKCVLMACQCGGRYKSGRGRRIVDGGGKEDVRRLGLGTGVRLRCGLRRA